MIKPYCVTTRLCLNDKRIFGYIETELLTELEAQAISDNPITILAADAYSPDPKNWRDLGSGWYEFRHGGSISLEVKKKCTLIVEHYKTIFDSRKNPIVSITIRKKIEPCEDYSLNDVFKCKNIDRAIEYLKQFDCPINFSLDK